MLKVAFNYQHSTLIAGLKVMSAIFLQYLQRCLGRNEEI